MFSVRLVSWVDLSSWHRDEKTGLERVPGHLQPVNSGYSPDSLSLGGAGSHPIGLECPEPCLSLACALQTPARSLRDLQTATAPN